ncbi:MAG TPA: acetyl-CoA carboxylase biotin carboxyl carrier protein [Candidatus Saccharimonadales bacterium]|jgi:acetyl-CoA carboxylase biotin carboxyl carrier protein|nr:acetyl-CoA carboxylase biotin carboxyl carrier protein [Candidatus Saccharimonadales bacterium]
MKGSKKQSTSSDVSAPGVDFGELERLLSFMSNHGLEEVEYAHGDLKIRLKKAGLQGNAAPVQSIVAAAPAPQSMVAQAPSGSPDSAAASPVVAQAAAVVAADEHIIKSPIVGTFYAGSSPDAGPFVRVGDKVEAGQTVCIIEAMKLMNEIEADVSGEIARVLVENGQPVEYGEPLFALRPSGKKK